MFEHAKGAAATVILKTLENAGFQLPLNQFILGPDGPNVNQTICNHINTLATGESFQGFLSFLAISMYSAMHFAKDSMSLDMMLIRGMVHHWP